MITTKLYNQDEVASIYLEEKKKQRSVLSSSIFSFSSEIRIGRVQKYIGLAKLLNYIRLQQLAIKIIRFGVLRHTKISNIGVKTK